MAHKLRLPLLLVLLLAMMIPATSLSAAAQVNEAPDRIAVLPFWVFDQQGNVIPQAVETDLARLSSVLPRAIAGRLVQTGQFEVLDHPLLESRDAVPARGTRELDRVDEILRRGTADQVIVGTVAQIQQAVVVSIQRFVQGPEAPILAGAATVRSNNAGDAINTVEQLLTQVFPPDSDVVPRPISRIVVVPSVLRIPVGGSAPIQAYAIDDLGRTLTTVTLVFQTNDDARAVVDERGLVTGISPGKAQVSLQPLGRPLAPGATLPRVEVTVSGPSLGLRAGMSLSGQQQRQPRVGLRLTPAHEIRTTPTTQTLPQAGSNPVNVLTSFFGALIGNQMLTMDLDFVPQEDISMTLSAVQRTSNSYFGTGVGVAVPMREGGPNGVLLRLTLGGQLPFTLRSNMRLPLEVNVDFIMGGAQSPPQTRLGISAGIDLFQ